MERERKQNGLIIALLVVTVLSLSVAFAATLSSRLTINGTATYGETKWNVYFDSAEVDGSSELQATSGPTISGTNAISYGVTLEENKSFVMKAVIKNGGTYEAKLNNLSVSGAEAYTGIVTYSFEGIEQGDTIGAGESAEVTVTVSMGQITNDNVSLLENGLSLNLSVIADFVQA